MQGVESSSHKVGVTMPTKYDWWRCVQLAEQIYLAKRIAALRGKAAPPMRVLEIGPGDYALSNVMRDQCAVYDTANIDDDDQRARWTGDIRDIVDRVPADSYDLIVACEVLEHMRLADSAKIVDQLGTKLVADGRILISVPILSVFAHWRRENGLRRAIAAWTP